MRFFAFISAWNTISFSVSVGVVQKMSNVDQFEERMISALGFSPTPSQRIAIKGLAMLVRSAKPRPTLVVDGFAGTGKTSLMRSFCDAAETFGLPVVLLAPTGRAAKVLANNTHRPAHTIHRIIYRQAGSAIDSEFDRSFNRWRGAVFVVDEASMVGDSHGANPDSSAPIWGCGRLLTDVVDFVFSREATKLVLIGDPDQLPPVGCATSPALDVAYLKSMGLTVGRVRLTDVVRQKAGSLILSNALHLRDIVENRQNVDCKELPEIVGKEDADVEPAGGEGFLEQIEGSLSEFGMRDVVIITRSNKRATLYNLAVRSQVLNYEDMLVKGDLLIVNKNNYLWSAKAGCDFIANGDIAEVVSIFGYSEMYGFHFADVSVRLIDRDDIDVDCKIILDLLTADAEVPDIDTHIPKCRTTRDICERLAQSVEADYADYTNQRKKSLDMRNDPWLNALQVRYAYALTCHKAQGGQWGAVFVDPGYAPPDTPAQEFARWLYTAVSRARGKLYVINYPKLVRP